MVANLFVAGLLTRPDRIDLEIQFPKENFRRDEDDAGAETLKTYAQAHAPVDAGRPIPGFRGV